MKSPAGSLQFTAYGQTDRGLIRARNEDSLLCDEQRGVFAVADGLGGLPQGDIASKTAIDELKRQIAKIRPGKLLPWKTIFEKINQAVIQTATHHGKGVNLGTTLTAVQVLPGRKLHIGHVGDSGIFLFNRRRSAQLTTDHTLAQIEIAKHGKKVLQELPDFFTHTLTRCIGQPTAIQVDTLEIPLLNKERILLYTDGVTKTWELAELRTAAMEATTPKALVTTIIDVANQQGGPDNITAIALFFDSTRRSQVMTMVPSGNL